MKKRLVATLLVVLMCSVVLSACSALEGLEKDIQVSLNVNGEIVGTYTVNSFNNAVVDEPAAPSGKSFLGWSAHSDWESMDINQALLSKNKTLLRYAELKDIAVDGKVTLYAVFGQIPRHDLAIAWYNKEGTSGLNQSIMDNFTTALKDFLQGKGYNVDEMDIVVRAYDGNVITSCGNIKADADIDIMVGWAARSNIEGTGGLIAGQDFLQNYGNITLSGAPKARYSAKLYDSDLVNTVYQWILETYGGEGATKDYDVADTPDPTPDPDPNPTKETIVVAWYNNTKSGLTQAIMDDFVTALKAHLTSQGKDLTKIDIVVRAYDGKVGESCAAIKAAGDVDIMVGWSTKSNLVGTGGLTAGTDFLQNYGDITLTGSTTARYAARIADDELTKLVYNWILTTYGGTDGATKDYDVADAAEGGSK